MNRLYFLHTMLLTTAISANAQKPAGAGAGSSAAAPDVHSAGYHIKYDHSALRIPGSEFGIGLIVPVNGGKAADTIGYPGSSGGWAKYHVEVDSGRFGGGMVRLGASDAYKKNDSVTVTVYTRKWLLGGRGKFLVSRKIPYNFEDSIVLLTSGNAGRSPGDHIKFGIRTIYDDKKFTELWYPVKKKDRGQFALGFDGGHLSTRKGEWMIDPDPTHIQNDRIRLFAQLEKAPAIQDTLSLMLDYTANYRCVILSAGDGHDLDATVDVVDDSIIQAKLLRVDVRDSITHRTYHYLLNTKGSSIAITTTGANGSTGIDGSDGLSGTNGTDGIISQQPVTTTNPDGTTTTTYVTSQGPGGDGSNGSPGDDGKDGGNGGNGGNIFIRWAAGVEPFLGLIHANSIAGSGGSGGRGGTGGQGGQGGNGTPSGRAGSKGMDGRNGFDGAPGKPGTVRFLPL